MASIWVVQLCFGIYWKLVMFYAVVCMVKVHYVRRMSLAAPESARLLLVFTVVSLLPLLLFCPLAYGRVPWRYLAFSVDHVLSSAAVLLVAAAWYRHTQGAHPRDPAEARLLVCVVLLLASLPVYRLLRLPAWADAATFSPHPRNDADLDLCAYAMIPEFYYAFSVGVWLLNSTDQHTVPVCGDEVEIVDGARSVPVCGDEVELID